MLSLDAIKEDCTVETPIHDIHQSLQRLIGLHRQLLEIVRLEREALSGADLQGVGDATRAKEVTIAAISVEETTRLKHVSALAFAWKRKISELTLSEIIMVLHDRDTQAAEQLRTALSALTLLIQRIREQNTYNREVIEQSLRHVNVMKGNIIGERTPRSETYNPQGRRATSRAGATGLIERKA
jgi:flagellar biosynthesis/type III secretory pathway chaperone